MNRKLSKTARRRRFIVSVIETVIVTAVMLGLICLLGWIVGRAAPALSGALASAAEAVIG